jgi:hypothetical protein
MRISIWPCATPYVVADIRRANYWAPLMLSLRVLLSDSSGGAIGGARIGNARIIATGGRRCWNTPDDAPATHTKAAPGRAFNEAGADLA